MYYTSGSRLNKVISTLLGCNNLKIRRGCYSRKVTCKRMIVLITIIASVSFAVFSIWKTTSKSDNDLSNRRCHISSYYEQLYNYRGQNSQYENYLLMSNIPFVKKSKRPFEVEFNIFRYLFKIDQNTRKYAINPDEEIQIEKQFRSNLTVLELETMFTTFHHFSEALKKANVTFMLYGGTLIGAHRHHTMIPWDDDIDVLVNGSQEEAMSRALESLPEYTLYRSPLIQWKFFSKNITQSNTSFAWTWPFIDIFLFGENETHIWDQTDGFTQLYMFRKADVFPLQFKPYHGSLQPVPCNARRVLSRTYVPTLCTTSSYNHKEERSRDLETVKTVKCKSLYRKFPFVFREKRDDYVLETVKVGDCILYQTKTALPCWTKHP